MNSRRQFLHQGAFLALSVPLLPATSRAAHASGPSRRHKSAKPQLRAAMRRDDQLLRLHGLGDGYKMTWAADDRLLVGVNDGPGWENPPTAFFSNRVWRMEGTPDQPKFSAINTYPSLNLSTLEDNVPHYYGHGLIAKGQHIYQFLSILDEAEERPRYWRAAKCIYSDDGGTTWRNHDGSTPVRWNNPARDGFTFFEEEDGCFSLLSILQMGQDYRANTDGYFYVYGVNGSVDGKMNQLILFRAPTHSLHQRTSYEFYAGLDAKGRAKWSRDLQDRQVVHEFPLGWVNSSNLFPGDLVLESWVPSVIYNEALGVYIMASAGIGCAPDGTASGKPSYLGLWQSETPWGPWRQFHEETSWTPQNDPKARAYAPQISPKWISADGKRIWLAWADLNGIREFGRDEAILEKRMAAATDPLDNARVQSEILREYIPNFAMSMQPIDIFTA